MALGFLWQFMKKYWWGFLFAPLLMASSVFCDLYLPTLMEKVVDHGILTKDYGIIYHYGLLMLIFSVVGLVCGGGSYFVSAKATAHAGEAMRGAMYEKLMSLSYPELDKFGVATLITRMTKDVSNVQNFLLSLQRSFVSAPIMFIGGLVMAFRVAPSLGFIFYVAVPFTILIITFVGSKLAKAYPIVNEKIDGLNQKVREDLLSIYVVKGFCQEDYTKRKFDKANEDLYIWQLRVQKIMIALSPFLMMAFNYSMIAIIWFGGKQVAGGDLAVGQIMAFLTYLSLILNAIISCSFILIMYAMSQSSIKRMRAVLETEITMDFTGKKKPKKMNLVFDKVSFSYKEEAENALSEVSFTLKEGERLGVVGETGSGKSTLLTLASRLYDPQEGRITLDGIDLKEIDETWLRKNLGLVQQDSTVLSGSIKENLYIANPKASDEALKEVLIKAQAKELLEASDRGLEGGLNQRGNDLSGGQKQRLSIARALLSAPRLLFLDDATSALDALTEKAFLDVLDKEKNLTQIIVSQRVSTLRRADKILVLKSGRVEAIGQHKDLIVSSPTYRAIVESQLGEESLHEYTKN